MQSFIPGTSITLAAAALRLSVAALITVAIGGGGLLLGAPELILPEATDAVARVAALIPH